VSPAAAPRAARRRDPEGRRQALRVAAGELIAEVGAGRVTHRAVAARADVPLGATTYYFPTLADLVAAGLEEMSGRLVVWLDEWTRRLDDGAELPRVLAELVEEYLADRRQVLLEYELYLAAARAPELRPLARAWLDGIRELLTPHTGPQAARAIAALVDGVVVQSLVSGEPVDRPALEAATTALLRDQG
jgi:TetR/AcrR family transcriptional regulator, regulator of biofilm formation and stress response